VTDCQSVSLGVGLMTRYLLLYDSYGLVFVGRPFWREDGSVCCICCWSLPAQSSSGPSPLGLATIFYCLRFETSLLVASYDSQGHGGGIRLRLHTGDNWTELGLSRDSLRTDHIENNASKGTSIVARGPLPSNGHCLGFVMLQLPDNVSICNR
jgi:hypothetical protein